MSSNQTTETLTDENILRKPCEKNPGLNNSSSSPNVHDPLRYFSPISSFALGLNYTGYEKDRGFEVNTTFINKLGIDVIIKDRNNLTIYMPNSFELKDRSAGVKKDHGDHVFIIRQTYTQRLRDVKVDGIIHDGLSDRSAQYPKEIHGLREEMYRNEIIGDEERHIFDLITTDEVRRQNEITHTLKYGYNKPNGGTSTTCFSVEYRLTEKELNERNGLVYFIGPDLVIYRDGDKYGHIQHPASNRNMIQPLKLSPLFKANGRLHGDASSNTASFNLLINDPDKIYGSRYIYVSGQVIKIIPTIVPNMASGIYYDYREIGKTSINHVGFEDIDTLPIKLYSTEEEAKTNGDPSLLMKEELAKKEHEIALSKKEAELLKAENARLREENIKLEAELNKEKLKREAGANALKDEYEEKSYSRKDHYEHRSHSRKDSTEVLKWVAGIATVAVGAYFGIKKILAKEATKLVSGFIGRFLSFI